MEEKLFESKKAFDRVEVFKNRIFISTKILGLLGDDYNIPISQVASIDQRMGKPLEILTSGGRIYKVLIPNSRIKEFTDLVLSLKEQK